MMGVQDAGADPSAAYLLGWLGLVEERVRTAVAARRAVDPAPDDPFRGLYLSDEQVERLLQASAPHLLPALADPDAPWAVEIERAADHAEAGGALVRLRHLTRAFNLAGLDLVLLLIAL